jgi:hypothetical protein
MEKACIIHEMWHGTGSGKEEGLAKGMYVDIYGLKGHKSISFEFAGSFTEIF